LEAEAREGMVASSKPKISRADNRESFFQGMGIFISR
jgi:hypothetical protein